MISIHFLGALCCLCCESNICSRHLLLKDTQASIVCCISNPCLSKLMGEINSRFCLFVLFQGWNRQQSLPSVHDLLKRHANNILRTMLYCIRTRPPLSAMILHWRSRYSRLNQPGFRRRSRRFFFFGFASQNRRRHFSSSSGFSCPQEARGPKARRQTQ
jgi:hypothetical protein